MAEQRTSGRFQWVDVAKGICIVLVVMMHSVLGVEKATQSDAWLHAFVEWARPFRMPDFFLISGLFLAARIDRPWRSYLDTKVVHFAYFYVLWLTIQFAVKAPEMIREHGISDTLSAYLISYVEPFGTLWFIYVLVIFFIAAKLVSGVPKWLVLAAAAVLHVAHQKTGYLLPDEFAERFVFFFTGYALAPQIFAFAERIAGLGSASVAALLVAWVAFNSVGVASGAAFTPGVDLAFSYVGIAAVVAVSVLLAYRLGRAGDWIAYCGQNSIAIYLAFTLFMGPTRVVLLKLGFEAYPDLVAIAAMTAGVVGSLILRKLVEGTVLGFLFTRPARFRLAQGPTSERRHPSPAAA